jgi:hypothetical protein
MYTISQEVEVWMVGEVKSLGGDSELAWSNRGQYTQLQLKLCWPGCDQLIIKSLGGDRLP